MKNSWQIAVNISILFPKFLPDCLCAIQHFNFVMSVMIIIDKGTGST